MKVQEFNDIVQKQLDICTTVLCKKAEEYADDYDRLHNFKVAQSMMHCDAKKALAGMMAKHTVSIYDMCCSGQSYTSGLWEEKITDHINYLLLLKAIVAEENYTSALMEDVLGNGGETK